MTFKIDLAAYYHQILLPSWLRGSAQESVTIQNDLDVVRAHFERLLANVTERTNVLKPPPT